MSYIGTLVGDNLWPFTATSDGTDITVRSANVKADPVRGIVAGTWFGGSDDSQDNGETASGVNTKNNPNVKGCSLPMSNAGTQSTQGSPIPKMPYLTTMVHVFNPANGAEVYLPVIDDGPSKSATTDPHEVHAIDLTIAAFRELGGNVEEGIMAVEYRIVGGAAHIVTS